MKQIIKHFLLSLLLIVNVCNIVQAQDIEINETNFPDANFRTFLTKSGSISGNPGVDGILTEAERMAITTISCYSRSIESIKGIEYFPNLQNLYVNNNNLTSLDLSANTQLTNIMAYANKITTINFGSITTLQTLWLYKNRLHCEEIDKILDINITNLRLYILHDEWNLFPYYFSPGANGDVEKNCLLKRHLERLSPYAQIFMKRPFMSDYSQYSITVQDILEKNYLNDTEETCHQLVFNSSLIPDDALRATITNAMGIQEGETFHSCRFHSLKRLTVSGMTLNTNSGLEHFKNLVSLSITNSSITSLDVSHIKSLKSLYCQDNQLTQLNLQNNTALQYLTCNNNQLTSLNVQNSSNLRSVYCQNNKLTSIQLPSNYGDTDNETVNFDISKNMLDEAAMRDIIAHLTRNISSSTYKNFTVASYVGELETNTWTRELYALVPGAWKTLFIDMTSTSRSGFPEDGYDYFTDGNTLIAIDEINFPDPAFRAIVATKLGVAEGESVTKLTLASIKEISAINKGIKDLKGIEFLTRLENLVVPVNYIEKLDVSKLRGLACLNIAANFIHCEEMTKLIESLPPNDNNINRRLIVYNTNNTIGEHNVLLSEDATKAVETKKWKVVEVNVLLNGYGGLTWDSNYSGVTFPTDFICETFDISQLITEEQMPDANLRTAVSEAYAGMPKYHSCQTNDLLSSITELNVSNHNITDLTGLNIFTNLSNLNVSGNPLSTSVSFDNHPTLTTLRITNCPNLEELTARNCQNLKWVQLGDGGNPNFNLRRLDLSGCSNFIGSDPDNPTLKYFRINTPQTDYTSISNYEKLFCKLEEVNMSGCTTIQNFTCFSSYLKSLNLSGCTNLTAINVNQSLLTQDDIDLTGCTKIREFVAHRSNITDANALLGKFANNLTQLQINGGKYNRRQYEGGGNDYITQTNVIREIDMSRVPASVEILMARHNLIEQLTISNKPNIRQIQINNNILWCADLSGLSAIQVMKDL